jgi:phosphoglycerate dehydrogenase-like enzyme
LTITPHNAANSDPRTLTVNVLQQIERLEAGQKLKNVVDRRIRY